jgi:trans-2,3-dihydro-3-hydroxyanthranilate isomerase
MGNVAGMGLTYHILDVFTERPLGGNPLAVVLEADHLSSAEMQAIAREFNLSETVFVLKPTQPAQTARIRIFTPGREMPFAGHPTIGAAVLLAGLRTPAVNGEQDAIIGLEEEAGNIRVGVRLRNGAAAYGEFDAPRMWSSPEPLAPIEDVSAALDLVPAELGFEGHVPVVLKGATLFAYVPVAGLDVISKVRAVPGHWSRAFTDQGIDGVYLYTRQCVRGQSSFHARMLAPDMGIAEDPATGAAAAGFAHVIQLAESLPDGSHKRSIEQGFEMGRPSTIAVLMTVSRGKVEAVRIGGHAVRVAEGQLLI